MTADEMLKECGFRCAGKRDCIELWIGGIDDQIMFDGITQTYHGTTRFFSKKLHLAIHEKLKELGWIK